MISPTLQNIKGNTGRNYEPDLHASRTLEVKMSDDMTFTPEVIRVKQGEVLKIVHHNKGKLLHEFVLGTPETLAEHAELMKKFPNMEHAEPYMAVQMGDKCSANTFPYIEVRHPSSNVEHEATTSKISEDQLFYCQQRGLNEEQAVSMIVNGFCKQVFKELPMEFAVEAQKLLNVTLEGAVG